MFNSIIASAVANVVNIFTDLFMLIFIIAKGFQCNSNRLLNHCGTGQSV